MRETVDRNLPVLDQRGTAKVVSLKEGEALIAGLLYSSCVSIFSAIRATVTPRRRLRRFFRSAAPVSRKSTLM